MPIGSWLQPILPCGALDVAACVVSKGPGTAPDRLTHTAVIWELVMLCPRIITAVLLWIVVVTVMPAARADMVAADGVRFRCADQQRAKIRHEMGALFRKMYLSERHIKVHDQPATQSLTYTLDTPPDDASTLDFAHRPEYWVYDEPVEIYGKRRQPVMVATVSQKEILLALLQHGRLTEFSGAQCSVKALVENLRMRQTIVAWTERVQWRWPDGGPSAWNPRFWGKTSVRDKRKLFDAFEDAFLQQEKYAIGCYAAIKLTYAFAMMDFYRRVNNNPTALARVKAALQTGDRPLAGIEPCAMWRVEGDGDMPAACITGKLLYLQQGVHGKNFVPGDWVYFVNTDPVSRNKTGYEGSNSIYLGRGWFSDFYNDVEHHYTFAQKLSEVYQWRHGVFSASRDYEQIEVLSTARLDALSQSLENGGIVLPVRAVPFSFSEDVSRQAGDAAGRM